MTRTRMRRRISVILTSLLLIVALSLANNLRGQDPVQVTPPGPQGVPNAYPGFSCNTGGPQISRRCANGTGFTCASAGPLPTVTGELWYIGSCNADVAGTTCNIQKWNCGASSTCAVPPVAAGNCASFVVCAN